MEIVHASIEKYDQVIPTKSKDQMAQLYRTLDIDWKEMSAYQTCKSLAFSQGLIDEPLAMFLYRKLGDWENTTLSERIVLTQVLVRLIKEVHQKTRV